MPNYIQIIQFKWFNQYVYWEYCVWKLHLRTNITTVWMYVTRVAIEATVPQSSEYWIFGSEPKWDVSVGYQSRQKHDSGWISIPQDSIEWLWKMLSILILQNRHCNTIGTRISLWYKYIQYWDTIENHIMNMGTLQILNWEIGLSSLLMYHFSKS